MAHKKDRWKLAFVLLVALACLIWALWGMDLVSVAESLRLYTWPVVLPMMGLYLLAHLIRSWRLRLLLDRNIPIFRLFSVTSIGFMAIAVVPLRLGELVRPYLLLKQDSVPLGTSMAAIFLERLLDFLMLLVMLVVAGLLVPLEPGAITVLGVDVVWAARRLAVGVVLAGLSFTLVTAWAGAPILRALEKRQIARSHGPLSRDARNVLDFFKSFQRCFATLRARPIRALSLLSISAALWAVTVVATWVALSGSRELGLSLADALVTWALTLSAMTAVHTPGFVGTFEAGCSGALRLLGVEQNQALTLALLVHAGQMVFNLGMGSLFLVWEGLSLGDLVSKSRQAVSRTSKT